MDALRTVGLVVHPTKPVAGSIRTITGYARRSGARVVAREADADRVGVEVRLLPEAEFVDAVDALVALGGDGTMLGAMRLVVGRPVPVLGVNHGNVGFLVEVTPAELPDALERLAEGRFTLEPHSCLDVDGVQTAFNDVLVTASRPWTSVNVDLVVNGARHGYYRGDGVIACTPTGSTAYNYAAGGPIVSPSAPSITLTPVAPMAGIGRSVVLGPGDVIDLHNPSDTDALRWSVDGVVTGRLDPGGSLTLRLHPDAVNVVRLDAASHERRSRIKLSLLDLPVKPDQLLELIPPRLREQLRSAREDATRAETDIP